MCDPPYRTALTRHLYRNALFARISLPHRFVAVLTVDILRLREVALGLALVGGAAAQGQGLAPPLHSQAGLLAGLGSSSVASAVEVGNNRNDTPTHSANAL